MENAEKQLKQSRSSICRCLIRRQRGRNGLMLTAAGTGIDGNRKAFILVIALIYRQNNALYIDIRVM